ncbi:MAG TPA: hypothetical protein VG734_14505 [Lacunisphaera sp.]|nr:hypothetical protein [Lacunisphaera sp.]
MLQPNRVDLDGHLIHFTKPTEDHSALEVLLKIVHEKRLLGGTGFVKGKEHCVSFTEAPLDILMRPGCGSHHGARYSCFGLRFRKNQICKLGGMPVKHQSEGDYFAMDPEHRWRHVRFELDRNPPSDWRWELEWRLRCKEFSFEHKQVEIILPSAAEERIFRTAISTYSYYRAWPHTQILEDNGLMYLEADRWRVLSASVNN